MRKGRKPITLSAGILILLFTLMPLGGCQQQKGEFQRQLSAVDSLMQTDADSAFRMLCTMDSLASLMPKALQMEHLLLRCNAQNKADLLFSSDSIGLELVEYYDRKGNNNQRMLAHYVLGCAYRDIKDFPSALQCFNDAVAAALLSLTSNKYIILLIMNVILLVSGTFMDVTPAILIFTPLFLPICQSFGMSTIQFGLILVYNLCIGNITPPVGNALFVGIKVGRTSLSKVMPYMLMYYVAIIGGLLLVTFIPAVSTALPQAMGLM